LSQVFPGRYGSPARSAGRRYCLPARQNRNRVTPEAPPRWWDCTLRGTFAER
jgi:hypothetical protein